MADTFKLVRLLLSEVLLGWAFDVMPDSEEKLEFSAMLANYYYRRIELTPERIKRRARG